MAKYICDYGCGREAKHQFANGKWCCNNTTAKCPGIRKKISIKLTGKDTWNKNKKDIYSKTTLKKMKDSHKGSKNYWYGKKLTEIHKQNISKSNIGKVLSTEHKNKLRITSANNKNALGIKYSFDSYNSRRLNITIIRKRYPTFYKEEELRYELNGEKIQVHCKNHNCPNSKEQSGWFTPTYIQLYERIRQIENKCGNGGCYFYCCEECKQQCPLYNLRSDPFKEDILPYTGKEYNIWKQTVLEQDNYECQMCGSKENLHCHHIIPIKLEPMFSLDPNNGIVLCKHCHYKYGHKTGTECSTPQLANKQC